MNKRQKRKKSKKALYNMLLKFCNNKKEVKDVITGMYYLKK